MTTLLILEGQSPEIVCAGKSYAATFVRCLSSIDPGLRLICQNPYLRSISKADFDGVDGIIFTGSGVEWNTSDERGHAQTKAMKVALTSGLPIWGSCNGLQLFVSAMGGEVGISPSGYEGGLARGLQMTSAGQSHPMMAGRSDGFEAPCIHRDEVLKMPDGMVLLASNGHSKVQAAVYDQDGIDFWGTQYHPEIQLEQVSAWMAEKDQTQHAEVIAHMNAILAGEKPRGDYTRELRNWLLHVRAKKIERNAAIPDLQTKYKGAETFEFGDNRVLCNLLVSLVRSGQKRATCGALADFENGNEAMPTVGREDICLDWDGNPALVIRTTEVSIRKFEDVDADFALAEGENESLQGWQDAHRRYFERNGGWSKDMELVCERFEVVEDLGVTTKD